MILRPLASFLLLPEQWFLQTQPEGMMSPADPFVRLWLVFSEDWTFQNSTCLCECGSCSSTRESPDFSNRTWAALTQSWGLLKSDRAFLSEVFFEKHLQLLLGGGVCSTISVAWEVSSWDPKYVLGMLGPLDATQCHEKPCVGVCYVYEKMFIRVSSMKHSEPLLFFIYKKASRSGGDFFKGRRKWTKWS